MNPKQNPINDPAPPKPGRLSNAVGFGLVLQEHRASWRLRRACLGCLPFQELRGLGRAATGTCSGDAPAAAFPWLLSQRWEESPANPPVHAPAVRPLRPCPLMDASPRLTGDEPRRPAENCQPSPLPVPKQARPLSNAALAIAAPTAAPAAQSSEFSNPAIKHRIDRPDSEAGISHIKSLTGQGKGDDLPWPGRHQPTDDVAGHRSPPALTPPERTPAPAATAPASPQRAMRAPAEEPPIIQRLTVLAGVPPKAAGPSATALKSGTDREGVAETTAASRPLTFRPIAPDSVGDKSAAPLFPAPIVPGAHDEPLMVPRANPARIVPDTPVLTQTVEKIVTRHLQRREIGERSASEKKSRTAAPLGAAMQSSMTEDREDARRLMGQMRRLQQSERFRTGHIR